MKVVLEQILLLNSFSSFSIHSVTHQMRQLISRSLIHSHLRKVLSLQIKLKKEFNNTRTQFTFTEKFYITLLKVGKWKSSLSHLEIRLQKIPLKNNQKMHQVYILKAKVIGHYFLSKVKESFSSLPEFIQESLQLHGCLMEL